MLRKSISTIGLIIFITTLFLYNWLYEAEYTVHSTPDYAKADIYRMVQHRDVPVSQLKYLARQTGVRPDTVKKLLAENKGLRLLELQAAYFAPVKIVSEPSSPLTVSEFLVDENGNYTKGTRLVDIQNGDILITKNSRFLGWRNGHVGLVVDAENELVLEALMLGTNTKLCSLNKWETLPSFHVLRLKEAANSNKLENICFSWLVAEYALDNLVDIPYSLTAGMNPREITITKTHCAHLIWYAYKQFGIDLDSDGGIIVTPTDIQNSPYLEVVQSYGY
ncbi:MAG: hypothetical protein IJ324_06850 [Lachnospiraceae bacterium]|nr:hypothetical protein [Lachnospiraceae bacterium]